ncbi:DUF2520 domain-containing protein [Agrobacterium tumefaciens]|uniref:Rossmann-like and DUF2520 domain-containing protein n=1 Tax=Agrobacterium tumefaciens TaxID=358 RepID=UPI0015742C81|nr:DUF2520 domain-containing protein [Agrobacterium tumefaciens]NTB94911.1 DUF2520 domain-containing protein [Agrobacterium tumefaciens]NTC44032.1 DUF2520 domain-containing protein [Agrobacterium tumefaciens]
MKLEELRIGFIGAGRLGKALGWHCARQGLGVLAVANRTTANAQRLAERIPGCEVLPPQDVAESCDIIFLTTTDKEIGSACNALRWRPGSFVVHCSGATEISELKKAANDGALIGGFHPLQTFGDPEAAMQSLPGCTITIEAEAPLDSILASLAARLECRVNRLPPGARPMYHAAAGYASQYLNALLLEASSMWCSWGGTEADAVAALMPLVRGTLASISQVGLAAAMPGPVSRGDILSVEKHITAIKDFDPAALILYGELCRRTIHLALATGRIDHIAAAGIGELLTKECIPPAVVGDVAHNMD